MYYYEVLVVQEYVGKESVFTYESAFAIAPFTFVHVPLQRKIAPGIVVRKTEKPHFATKAIQRVSVHALGALQRHLVRFITEYYAATEAQALQLFVPSFLDALPPESAAVMAATPPSDLPPFSPEQAEALKILRSHPAETVLLHGETGSGKTRLYLERMRDVLAKGSSILILVPEIALVPHIAHQCEEWFGPIVDQYHSKRTRKKRAALWQAIAAQQQRIIVGTRSALFLPFSHLGLVIIDESHEPAYKQEEGVRYHATRLASVMAHWCRAQLILGSATPLVGDVYLAKQRRKPIARLLQTAITSDATAEHIVVDMKQRDDFTRHPMLSNTLLKAVADALQRGEQSLIYLNRRGTARAVLCSTCGWQATCPICAVSLTYHHDTHQLRCHTCGYLEKVAAACPTCGSTDILFKSAGTKALASWMQTHFPSATVGRFDTDNSLHESLHEQYAAVRSGEVQILVGTQMLVKGLDLPKLAVVGIVAADLSLQIPDFTAEERTYQLLRQAMGRVGRGHTNSTTIIQTFNPENAVLRTAIDKNYDEFYTTQIEQRKAFQFSPIMQIASFWYSKKSADSALSAAQTVVDNLSKNTKMCTFLGPVLTFHPRRRGMQTAQIVVKCTTRSELVRLAGLLPTGWQYDLEPITLL